MLCWLGASSTGEKSSSLEVSKPTGDQAGLRVFHSAKAWDMLALQSLLGLQLARGWLAARPQPCGAWVRTQALLHFAPCYLG